MKIPSLVFNLIAIISLLHASEELGAYPLLSNDVGLPMILISGTVYPFASISPEDARKESLPDESKKALATILDYLAALKSWNLQGALALVKEGPSRERAKKKFDATPVDGIAQRKNMSFRFLGLGITDDKAVVWYEMRGDALPGGRFPWLDQLVCGPSGWSVVFDAPINSLGNLFFSALMEIRTGQALPIKVNRDNFVLFSVDSGGGTGLALIDNEKKIAQRGALLLAVDRSIIQQKHVPIDKLVDKNVSAKAVRAVQDAFVKIHGGEAYDRFFAFPASKKPVADPFGWKNEDSGYSYCWAMSPAKEGTYFVIGTATEAMVAFVLDAEFKIRAVDLAVGKSSCFNLITKKNIIPEAINLARKALN